MGLKTSRGILPTNLWAKKIIMGENAANESGPKRTLNA